jgi:hypothetical protein
MSFAIGDNVKVKCTVLQGAIINGAMDAELNVLYLVEYVDDGGVTQQRYFKVAEIEAA